MESTTEFIKDWKQIRGKTLEFLESLPEELIMWRPNELLGTFGMQIRHMCKSQEAYIKGVKSGRIDFSDKKYDKSIEKDKKKLLSWMNKLDKELISLVKKEQMSKQVVFIDGVYGEQKVPLSMILTWLIQHETYHQGVFTCYGRLAGLGKFTFM